MGNTDSIPVVSQAKSGVQLLCGDTDGAARTQENFFRECPGVSQITSTAQLIAGDPEGALETQKRCFKGLSNAADGVPVVGHAKGLLHYACGDTEGGHQAMKSATRTTGVLAGGAGGFVVGGPVGAVAGGIYGGTVMDLGTTIVTNEKTGYVAAIDNAIKNPNPADLFDLTMMPVFDGIAGYGAGKMVESSMVTSAKVVDVKAGKALEAQGVALYETMEAKLEANPQMSTGEYMNGMKKSQNMINAGRALQGETFVSPVDKIKAGTSAEPVWVPQQQSSSKDKEKRRNNKGSESDSDDEDCICKDVTIPVLYVNIRSLNPNNMSASMASKKEKLKALISVHQPRLIAIVETWLTPNHSDGQIRRALGLDTSYEIFRQDRRDGQHPGNAYGDEPGNADGNRRGGGILLAWRTACQSSPFTQIILERESSEDFADNIVNSQITCAYGCRKCHSQSRSTEQFAFTVVYRRPSRYNNEGQPVYDEINNRVVDRLVHIPNYFEDVMSPFTSWALVGDFNWRNGNVLEKYLDHNVAEVVPMSQRATHNRGGALDLVIAKKGFVRNLNDISSSVVDVTDPISDHSALLFNLKLGKDFPSHKKCQAKRCT